MRPRPRSPPPAGEEQQDEGQTREGHARYRDRPLAGPYPARPEGCSVEILQGRAPTRAFVKIARIDVHIEWSAWYQPRLDDAEPELRKQACLAGADAVMDIEERTGSHIETKRYHVIATGIKYRP